MSVYNTIVVQPIKSPVVQRMRIIDGELFCSFTSKHKMDAVGKYNFTREKAKWLVVHLYYVCREEYREPFEQWILESVG